VKGEKLKVKGRVIQRSKIRGDWPVFFHSLDDADSNSGASFHPI
jgi:hypothetical protein